VFLIGPMGAGKSTVGQLLASLLGRVFLDLDTEVERRAGRSVSAIFAEDGEAAFRQIEAEALRDAAQGAAVVAVGGGAPAWPGNLEVMRAAGPVVLLAADVETLARRLAAEQGGAASRPLLADAVRQGRLREALEEILVRRAAAYAQADLRVDAVRAPQEIAEEIAARLGARPAPPGPGPGEEEEVLVHGGAALPAPTYQVRLDAAPFAEERLCDALLAVLPRLSSGARLALLTDENVARLHLPRVQAALLRRGVHVALAVVPPGEGSKTLAQVERTAMNLLSAGVDRGAALLALGGGVVSDLGGFVAATLLRGIPWAAAPTTLLAQADAAIGGKTAVNLPLGKNLVGAFHPPRLVYADLTTLSTLPQRELASGLGEVVKHALLIGPDLLSFLRAHAEAARAGDPQVLKVLVHRSCQYKAEVVAADPQEQDPEGGRLLLNLGHTVGHALEIASAMGSAGGEPPLTHGEAVGLGLCAAARIGRGLGLTPPDLEQELHELLTSLGLPTDLEDRLFPGGREDERVLEALLVDKKRVGRRVRFIVPLRPGRCQVVSLEGSQLLLLLKTGARLQ
jgi:shikimate kinase/3-dehydroquinate synthase